MCEPMLVIASKPSWFAFKALCRSTFRLQLMHHTQTLQQVRELIGQRFQVMGVTEESQLSESILIQDGCYCGRRFSRDGVQAIWFVEEEQVKFYCREGTVVQVCSLHDTPDVRQNVAA